ncbi:DUF742 domain-containing protein [Streptomyces sp. NPDC060194]|uniref:DUF742 domain-containing protein n=1 Tax=Streptomyces sp. NPDC060194 TaxID=3347069 RepID=UPI0036643FDC
MAPPVTGGSRTSTGDAPSATGGGQWYDADAGPLIRPYAATRAVTEPAPEAAALDLVASVAAREPGAGPADGAVLGSEHLALLRLCAHGPRALAELAAESDLPAGAVRVLVSDLVASGHVTVHAVAPAARLFDEAILMEVIDGLRAL